MILFIHTTTSFADEKSKFPDFINFGVEKGSENFATYSELEVWANYQGWSIDQDQGWMGLRNHICRMIPEEGYEFLMQKDPESKTGTYLYLEFTKYNPGARRPLLPRVLRIYVNGKLREVLEVGRSLNFQNPVRIWLDPSEYSDSRILIRLEPVGPIAKGRYWGIWDAFLSEKPI
ncbi:hypothetical protein O4O04_16045 [Leptospira sp. GIMC2001]|nr:hypothetical protein [Leptospira sp. GIMC2001]WCL48799.1 hypothetical protein O4O04_16045 [Leptospira sp. GIMC2001]